MACAKALRLGSVGSDESMSFAARDPPSQLLHCLHGPSWVVHVARFENQSTDSQSWLRKLIEENFVSLKKKKKKKEFKPVKEATK